MTLKEFISRNKIKISKELLSLCNEGFERMEKSKDPLHSSKHILEMFDDLDSLLRSDSKLKEVLDFEILLPAICWHDVWKSTRAQTANPFVFVYEQFYEGVGSEKLLTKFLDDTDLEISEKIIEEIKYCIRIHPRPTFYLPTWFEKIIFKPKTPEVRVLLDLDALDVCSIHRLENFYKTYLVKFPVFLLFIKWWVKKAEENIYYYKWSQKEHFRRSEILIAELDLLWKKRKVVRVGGAS